MEQVIGSIINPEIPDRLIQKIEQSKWEYLKVYMEYIQSDTEKNQEE